MSYTWQKFQLINLNTEKKNQIRNQIRMKIEKLAKQTNSKTYSFSLTLPNIPINPITAIIAPAAINKLAHK
jgi:hypothetical protein